MSVRERFILKRRLQELQRYEGSSTSMVSLYIRPGYQIPMIVKMLVDERGASENIKDRVNRQSVQEAITSAAEKLKTLPAKALEHGLCLFSGSVLLADGRTKRIVYVFEPSRDVGTCYRCDRRFHVDELLEQLESGSRYGFIVVDGNGALYGLLAGSEKRTLQRFVVELQSKSKAGGQSAVRFERLRKEQRRNYERKVCEQATACFIANDRPNVEGLFIAGSAEFKDRIVNSDMFDPRLKAVVKGVLDVQYGGENGFNQAVELAQPALVGLKLADEAKTLTTWMTAIAVGDEKVVFGLKETLHAYEEGVVERLIVWDKLSTVRYVVAEPESQRVVHADKAPELERNERLVDEQPLVEWLAENITNGTELHIVSDATAQGTQFAKGFGGLGGYLRYAWRPAIEHEEPVDDSEFEM